MGLVRFQCGLGVMALGLIHPSIYSQVVKTGAFHAIYHIYCNESLSLIDFSLHPGSILVIAIFPAFLDSRCYVVLSAYFFRGTATGYVTEHLDRVETPPNLSAAPPLLVAFEIYLRNALMHRMAHPTLT